MQNNKYISRIIHAFSIPFDNDTNGFTADNVQDAIEESRTSAVGDFIEFDFVTNGNTSNKWLGYSNSAASSDMIPYVAPHQMEIKALTFSNFDDNVDIDVEIYRNGTIIYTWEVRNKRTAYKANFTGLSFNQGDRMSVFLRKFTGGTGDTTAQDPIIEVLTKITSEVDAEGGTQYGV